MRLMGLMALLLLLGACSQQKDSNVDYERASEINTNLGIAYMQSGDLNQAKEKMEKAIKQNPESATANMAYGLLMQRIKEPDIADKHFKKALSLNPGDPNLQNNYGGFLCSIGKYEEGVAQFLKAMENPLYTTPQFAADNIGSCYLKQGDLSRAEAFYRKSLEIDKRFPSALYNMARLSYLKEEYLATRGYLQRFNDAVGDIPGTLWLCYQVEQELNNGRDANLCADKLLDNFPNSKEAKQLSLIYER